MCFREQKYFVLKTVFLLAIDLGMFEGVGEDSRNGIGHVDCEAPKPGGPLTTRQPAEYSWMSGYPTPLTKIGQSLLCTGSSTQGTTCPNNQQ